MWQLQCLHVRAAGRVAASAHWLLKPLPFCHPPACLLTRSVPHILSDESSAYYHGYVLAGGCLGGCLQLMAPTR